MCHSQREFFRGFSAPYGKFLKLEGRLTMAQPGVNRQRKKGLLTPLDYMLGVINDPAAEPERRDRMAICAAQYCHPRAANHPETKRGSAAKAAKHAGGDGWGDDLSGDWSQ
jgi:hypothetical protein